MYKKITTEQVSDLKVGDIIKRYPQPGEPLDVFDEKKTILIDTYIVKTIQANNGIIGLIGHTALQQLLPSPGSVSRLFIHEKKLVEQKIWWLSTD